MSPTQSCITAASIVALSYLAETLYGPVVGRVALGFGKEEAIGYAYVSVAFYGSALSGLLILALANRWCLERCLAVALVAAPALNLLSLDAGSWELALAFRFGSGLCSGVAVGAVVIGFAQRASGDALARKLSLTFSLAFLALAPAMAAVPHVVATLGLQAPAYAHLALCAAIALTVRGNTFLPSGLGGGGMGRLIATTFSRVFWSSRKCVAFGLHTTSLLCAYLVLFGTQPALGAAGVAEGRIGIALAALSAATCAGGFLHAWLTRGAGLGAARWVLIAWGTASLIAAAACIAAGGQTAIFAAVMLFAGLQLMGGPPTFEAILYDLGPADAVAGGLQRCLGMGLATAVGTSVIGLAVWGGIDIAKVLLLTLSAAYTCKAICYRMLWRAECDPGARHRAHTRRVRSL